MFRKRQISPRHLPLERFPNNPLGWMNNFSGGFGYQHPYMNQQQWGGFPMQGMGSGWNQPHLQNQFMPFQGGFPFQNQPMPQAHNGNWQSPFQYYDQQATPQASPQSMWNAASPFMNPYPTQNQQQVQQPKQFNAILNQFKGQDGNIDMKKMMDTAGQMMNTVNQLNGMIKGIAATFKA
ncbi:MULTISPECIES: YppG family protein [Bacillus]|uniref:YppG family protein n=1 Tax=Bacillus TaxID=1386 RepID=UPI000BB8C9F8|nr:MULTISPECIES: YppG family protein [Bacillus]